VFETVNQNAIAVQEAIRICTPEKQFDTKHFLLKLVKAPSVIGPWIERLGPIPPLGPSPSGFFFAFLMSMVQSVLHREVSAW